jgi:signal peptidase I
MNKEIRNTLKENRFFIALILLMVVFRTSFADWNVVPTGSMKPTIVEGDRIWVNKIAYDLNIPFTHISLKNFADPKRGDIVIFDSTKAEKRLVKRVIGIPGDTVSMINNAIFLNGKALTYKMTSQHLNHIIVEEKLTQSAHKIRLELPLQNRADSFTPITIPQEFYLVLGDNRNNSADSRFIGFIPRKEIIGRARNVVISLDYDNYYLPRVERFLQQL